MQLEPRAGIRPEAGQVVLFPLSRSLWLRASEFEPQGDIPAPNPDCTKRPTCRIDVEACSPLVFEVQTETRTILLWKGRPMAFEGDWTGRLYQDRAECLLDATSGCRVVV
jgi:hypothetical protein